VHVVVYSFIYDPGGRLLVAGLVVSNRDHRARRVVLASFPLSEHEVHGYPTPLLRREQNLYGEGGR